MNAWPPFAQLPGGPRNRGAPFPIKALAGGGGDPFADLKPVGGNPRSLTNLRTGPYIWTLSAVGTGEYYATFAAAANPSLASPIGVVINNAQAVKGSALGSLTASQWQYGNNDTLGFNTVYVRLADDTDPDTKADGFVRMIA